MKIVVINRFLSGTRAIIGFFVGMMALPKTKTMIFAGISSLTFYGILAVVGYYFGRQDWEIVIKYLHIYEKIALAIGAILLIGLISF
jgi:membrane protein DedA with SNARE-associated domain